MELKTYTKDDINIIELTDKLDGTNARTIQDEILNQIQDNYHFVLDMSKCGYISSAGLQVLLAVFKRVKANNGSGALACVLAPIKEIIKMSGFDKIIDMYDNLDDAVEKVKK